MHGTARIAVCAAALANAWPAPSPTPPRPHPSFIAARIPGDFQFDPMGLKPKGKAELETMQAKEINNGRLAMIGIMAFMAEAKLPGAVPGLVGKVSRQSSVVV